MVAYLDLRPISVLPPSGIEREPARQAHHDEIWPISRCPKRVGSTMVSPWYHKGITWIPGEKRMYSVLDDRNLPFVDSHTFVIHTPVAAALVANELELIRFHEIFFFVEARQLTIAYCFDEASELRQ